MGVFSQALAQCQKQSWWFDEENKEDDLSNKKQALKIDQIIYSIENRNRVLQVFVNNQDKYLSAAACAEILGDTVGKTKKIIEQLIDRRSLQQRVCTGRKIDYILTSGAGLEKYPEWLGANQSGINSFILSNLTPDGITARVLSRVPFSGGVRLGMKSLCKHLEMLSASGQIERKEIVLSNKKISIVYMKSNKGE